jgi:hypothetical protein
MYEIDNLDDHIRRQEATADRLLVTLNAVRDQMEASCLDLGRLYLAQGVTDEEQQTTRFGSGLLDGQCGETVDEPTYKGARDSRLYYAGYAKGWDEGGGGRPPSDPDPWPCVSIGA